ncbi:hypothetical protein EST38_g1661 [Candolleomyces aberdarensis]|uniref:Fungal-type protein kinase domain-containing protein n=1 Tax=Candolleomyces aberdarensis TaxID=2316362 RepID=A0A4Q2DVJ5_9AGAR|nr:hypothetical protein EST38_g1661 [Candolleomyces aberdarensis]
MQELAVHPQTDGGPLLEGGDVEANRFQDLCRVLELDTENPDLNPQVGPQFKSQRAFLNDANTASREMRNQGRFPFLLVFKDTQHFFPHGHVSDTKANPDFIAAFEEHWYDARSEEAKNQPTTATPAADQPAPTTETDSKKHVIWPCIRLAGENASKSDTKPGQVQHATTYLDLLLLSRADFRGGFGLRLTETHMSIIVAIGGSQLVINFSFSWTGAYVRRAAYALVYRLYDPGRWLDPEIKMVYHKAGKPFCTYNISFPGEGESDGQTDTGAGADAAGGGVSARGQKGRIRAVTHDGRERDAKQEQQTARMRVFLSDYSCLHGSCTFGTRTHVFVHQPLKSPNDVKVGRRAPRVVKIQLCRDNLRFDEIDILNNIHRDGKIPGVVRLACHERLPSIVAGREQFRLGLEQRGSPFMSIKTPRQMLMVAYDALEITRILHNERNVIHRDVSKGNILFVPPPGTPDFTSPAETSSGRSDPPPACSPVEPDEYPSSPSTVDTQGDSQPAKMSSHNSDPLPAGPPVNEYPPPSTGATYETAQEELCSRPGASVDAMEEESAKQDEKYCFIAALLGHSYRPLSLLISDMGRHLTVDPYWFSDDDPRSNPQYVHECFQRTIFNFLINNFDEPFMVCKTSDTSRTVFTVPKESTTPSLSMSTLNSEFALPYLLPVPEVCHRTIPSKVPPYPATFTIPRARSARVNADEAGVFRLYKVSRVRLIVSLQRPAKRARIPDSGTSNNQ